MHGTQMTRREPAWSADASIGVTLVGTSEVPATPKEEIRAVLDLVEKAGGLSAFWRNLLKLSIQHDDITVGTTLVERQVLINRANDLCETLEEVCEQVHELQQVIADTVIDHVASPL